MKKISIIIPNHNNGKFIKQCLDSVTSQNYNNKEIIVVDDGSTDNSVGIIKKYIETNQHLNITLIRQNVMNASIARNEGMKKASGDWVIFLDSDDLLEPGIIDHYSKIIDYDIDLIICNYNVIDEENRFRNKNEVTREDKIIDAKKSFARLADLSPVPSNKLYNLNLIKERRLEWKNVRIGQDLNFFLKYLSLCKKVAMSNYDAYQYRITNNSISRTYDFRIFDIVNVFEDIEKYYVDNKKSALYKNYICAQALKHYNTQMNKYVFYENRLAREIIIKYFAMNEKRIDYSSCLNNYAWVKPLRLKFHIKCIGYLFLTSSFYCKYKNRKNG